MSFTNRNLTPHQVDKARDYWLDPGDLFDEQDHSDDCEDEDCEGDCVEYSEPDYESMIEDRIEYQTDRWLDNNGY